MEIMLLDWPGEPSHDSTEMTIKLNKLYFTNGEYSQINYVFFLFKLTSWLQGLWK